MRNWFKRTLSLLLALVLVLGCMPASLTVHAEEGTDNYLEDADGIIWVTKNGEAELTQMTIDGLLDDVVREALGDTSESKVLYQGIDVENAIALFSKMESLKNDFSADNKSPIIFKVGGADKKIAVRNLQTVSVQVTHNGNVNKIYIDSDRKPESVAELQGWIEEAFKTAEVTVTHNGYVKSTGLNNNNIKENKARYESSTLTVDEGLLAEWPIIDVSRDSNEFLAGKVKVSMSSVDGYTHEHPVEVYLRDTRERATITVDVVNASGVNVDDPALSGYLESYPVYVNDPTPEETIKPQIKYYNFKEWATPISGNVVPGLTKYTAVVTPGLDKDGNGYADENQEFNITYLKADGSMIQSTSVKYGDSTPVIDEADAGKPNDGKTYTLTWMGLDADDNYTLPWQSSVTGNMTYKAVWLEGFYVTATVKMRDKVFGPVVLTVEEANHDDNSYKVITPGWNIREWLGISDEDTEYKETGWYYDAAYLGTVSGGDAVAADDINKDNIDSEKPFAMSTKGANGTEGTTGTLLIDPQVKLDLFYEIYTTKYGNKEFADGTAANPLYNYEFKDANENDLTDENIESGVSPDGLANNADFTLPVYEEKGIYEKFLGWQYNDDRDNNKNDSIYYYTAKPVIKNIRNEVKLGAESLFAGYTLTNNLDEDGKLHYIWTHPSDPSVSYRTYVVISGMTEETPGVYNFLYDENVRITASPIWEVTANGEKMYSGVAGVSCSIGTVNKAIELTYDNYIASGTAVDLNADTGVVVNIAHTAPVIFNANSDISLPAGQGQSEYTNAVIYDKAIVKTGYTPVYDANNVSVTYLARAAREEVKVSVYKLFDLFEAEGLGVLLKDYSDLNGTHTITLPEAKWLTISEMPAEEKSAQKIVDEFIVSAFEDMKVNKFSDYEDFAENLIKNLFNELNTKVVRRFGYVAPGESEPSETVKIAYDNGKMFAETEATIKLDEGRDETEVRVKQQQLTVDYQYDYKGSENVAAKVLDNIVLWNVTKDEEISKEGLVFVTNNAGSAYDFATATSGTYADVTVLFKGTEEYQPDVSEAFKLTINALNPVVDIKDEKVIIEVDGENYQDYYQDAVANISPLVPSVQVIAGISLKDNQLNKSLELVDDKIVIDAWVKLPKSLVELLDEFDLDNLKDFVSGIPSGKIQAGAVYEKEHLEDVLEKYAQNDDAVGVELVNQLLGILDTISNEVLSRLGVVDDNYVLRIRMDSFESTDCPTATGAYVNYAATLSKFTTRFGYVDPNYGASHDYGFIVISPMLPIPNRGGVQLYDDDITKPENLYVYEYNGDATVKRALNIAVNGVPFDEETPDYYGYNTRFQKVKVAPSTPGVYFVGYSYLKENNQVGSDAAVIIIKQREVNLEVEGEIVEYDGENHIATVTVTDKKGNEITDAGVTVISGTANEKVVSTNVTANDLYGAVNIDLPEGLTIPMAPDWAPVRVENIWNDYRTEILKKSEGDKITPSEMIAFLEYCGEKAEEAANYAAEEFKTLAVDETAKKILNEINGVVEDVDVSSDSLVAKTERIQDLMKNGKAYYDRLVDELTPLKRLEDNVWITFYDLKAEPDKLGYNDTGIYLYIGVVTDLDFAVTADTGVVVIHSEKDYYMEDTYVPYDGQPHDIFKTDETKRGDVTVILDRIEDGVVLIDRNKKEVHVQVDSELAEVICDVLNEISDRNLSVDSGFYVGTVYTKTQNVANRLTDKIMEVVEKRAVQKITADYPQAGEPLNKAIDALKAEMVGLTNRLLTTLQELDKMENGTQIIINDLLPVDLGTYEVTTFEFNIKDLNFRLDDDLFNGLKQVLEEKGYTLNKGSDGYVVTGYEAGEKVAEYITEELFDRITAKVEKYYLENPLISEEEALAALDVARAKLLEWEGRLSAKMQQIDGADDYTRIVINGELPVEVGTYEFYGFSYDVAATRGKLVIQKAPITITMDDQTVMVGDKMPTFTYTVDEEALIGNDSADIFNVVPVCDAENTNTAGTYTISAEPITHDYYDVTIVDGELVVKEEITGKIIDNGRSLSLYGVIYINQYVKIEGFDGIDLDDEDNSGLLVWNESVAAGLSPDGLSEDKIAEEEFVYGTESYDQKKLIKVEDEYYQQTEGFAAAEYADVVYMRAYVKIGDNEYAYGPLKEYSVRHYCESKIEKDATPDKLKNTCIAMLHYGASAQKYFGYNVNDLANKNISNYQDNLYDNWNGNLIDPLKSFTTNIVASSKVVPNGKSVSLDSTLLINYYYKFGEEPENVETAEVLFWDGVEGQLTVDNISYRMDMTYLSSNKEYYAQSAQYPAALYSKTIFACARFVDKDGNEYYGDVVAYSPEEYAASKIRQNSNEKLVETVKRMVTYGEYANKYFF